MPVIPICLSPGLQRSVTIDSLAPGEMNRLHSVAVDVAGKGVNVCRVLQRLGVEALCLAQGGDNADEMMALAGLEGLNLRLIPSTGRLRTCTSVIEMRHAAGCRGHSRLRSDFSGGHRENHRFRNGLCTVQCPGFLADTFTRRRSAGKWIIRLQLPDFSQVTGEAGRS